MTNADDERSVSPEQFEAQVAAAEAAFFAALDGRAAIPAYHVSTGAEGEFIASADDPDLDRTGRALIAGDCRRRFIEQARTGIDGFTGLRRP